MCIAKIGQHGNGWLDDVAQGQHLTGLADTCLEDAHLGIIVHEPHREGHTDLRVIAAWTAGDIELGREQLVEPFLDHGLAVAARDADDRDVELVAVALSEALQGFERVDDFQEVGIGIVDSITGRHVGDHKVADTTAVELRDVVMSIVTC